MHILCFCVVPKHKKSRLIPRHKFILLIVFCAQSIYIYHILIYTTINDYTQFL